MRLFIRKKGELATGGWNEKHRVDEDQLVIEYQVSGSDNDHSVHLSLEDLADALKPYLIKNGNIS
jgi:hypothetical protein